MNKTIICNIPMKPNMEKTVYACNDTSLYVSEKPVCYPISALFSRVMEPGDRADVLMLVKKDNKEFWKQNADCLEDELKEANEELKQANNGVGAVLSFKMLDTDFEESRAVHEQLMGALVDEIKDGSHIIADITFGPKDVPIIVFAVLGFAEKSLGCEVDHIIYGQANFENGRPVNTKICDMSPLYYLASTAATVCGENPERARKTLTELISL